MQATKHFESFAAGLRKKGREIVKSASDLSPLQFAVIIILAVFIITGGALSYIRSKPKKIRIIEPKKTEIEADRKIKVHVAGSVVKPGLYEFREGMRVADAIKVAGGETQNAAVDRLNLAEKLKDGQKITVPQKCADNSLADSLSLDHSVDISGGSRKVNINTATSEELESLPGIGPALASRIIKFRREKGCFSSISALKNVPGIGQRKFESLKDLVEI